MTRKDIASTGGPAEDESEREAYTARYDWDGTDDPTWSIVRAVAAVTGTEPTDAEPLYEVIDTDAVNRLFARERRARPDQLSFRFDDCDVTVHGDGRVVITPYG